MKKYQIVSRELTAIERAVVGIHACGASSGSAAGRDVLALEHPRGARVLQLQSHAGSHRRRRPESLRSAIIAANASGQNCMIRLQAGTYTLRIPNTDGLRKTRQRRETWT